MPLAADGNQRPRSGPIGGPARRRDPRSGRRASETSRLVVPIIERQAILPAVAAVPAIEPAKPPLLAQV
jgi:hypothetical protein